MPDLAGPFDSSTFAQAQYYRDRGHLEPSGVQGTPATTAAGGDLGLTAAGFGLTLALGRAHVRGAAYERTGTAWTDTVPANSSSVGPRNDLVVLRRDLTAKTVVPVRIQGTAAATPADPALTQVEDGTWDLPLFRVQAPASSGTPLVITDLRKWLATDGDWGWRNLTANSPLVVGGDGFQYRVVGRTCFVTGQLTYGGGSWAAGFVLTTVPVVPSRKHYVHARRYTPTGDADLIVDTSGNISVDEAFTSSGLVFSTYFPIA